MLLGPPFPPLGKHTWNQVRVCPRCTQKLFHNKRDKLRQHDEQERAALIAAADEAARRLQQCDHNDNCDDEDTGARRRRRQRDEGRGGEMTARSDRRSKKSARCEPPPPPLSTSVLGDSRSDEAAPTTADRSSEGTQTEDHADTSVATALPSSSAWSAPLARDREITDDMDDYLNDLLM